MNIVQKKLATIVLAISSLAFGAEVSPNQAASLYS